MTRLAPEDVQILVSGLRLYLNSLQLWEAGDARKGGFGSTLRELESRAHRLNLALDFAAMENAAFTVTPDLSGVRVAVKRGDEVVLPVLFRLRNDGECRLRSDIADRLNYVIMYGSAEEAINDGLHVDRLELISMAVDSGKEAT